MTNKEHAFVTIRKLYIEAEVIEDFCRLNGLPFSRQIVIELHKTLKSYEKPAKGSQK